MSWNYSGDPSTSTRDEVRFLIGDTDAASPELSDEEINWIISQQPDQGTGYPAYRAAAAAARQIASKYTKALTKTVGSLSINYAERRQSFSDLADSLESQANKAHNSKMGVPVLGGGGQTFLMGDDWR